MCKRECESVCVCGVCFEVNVMQGSVYVYNCAPSRKCSRGHVNIYASLREWLF